MATTLAQVYEDAAEILGIKSEHQALTSYDSAVKLNPWRYRYLAQKGIRLFDRAIFQASNSGVDNGLATLEDAWDRNPREQEYPLNLGRLNLRLDGAFPVTAERALVYLDQAIQLAPNDPRAHYYKARALYGIDPSESQLVAVHDSLANALLIAPEYEDALAFLEQLENGPRTEE